MPLWRIPSFGESMTDSANGKPLLKLVDVHKSFGTLEVIRGVNLEVHDQERLTIIGPSGSGKSTLLRVINFLEWPTGGRVYFKGELVGYKEKNGRLRPDES